MENAGERVRLSIWSDVWTSEREDGSSQFSDSINFLIKFSNLRKPVDLLAEKVSIYLIKALLIKSITLLKKKE